MTTSGTLLADSCLLTIVREKFYLDSVALMRHSKVLAEMPGIEDAAMMMATPANRAIMQSAGLLKDAGNDADGGDLLISVRGDNQQHVDAAIAQATELLERPRSQDSGGKDAAFKPRSIRSAVASVSGASLALISVPGAFAVAEARNAIRSGLHVMIFSDNVPLADEAELKREAQTLGKLVMGPDCGTAIISQLPLAFANQIRHGDIGIIGASGTGIQEVSCLLHHAGAGVTHAIGVGGRDLYSEVGGISTLMALRALESDHATRHIVLVSKPPAADVAKDVLAAVARSQKTFTLCFIGHDNASAAVPSNAKFVATLKAAAEHASGSSLQNGSNVELPACPAGRKRLVGLYTGGTLCAEAQVIAMAGGVIPVSNTPIPGAEPLDATATHVCELIDLGADEYTRGQPHPMIEPSVRDDVLLACLGQGDVGCILLDVVLGFGSHADPAGHLAALINAQAADQSDRPLLLASVTGTEQDPQVRSDQVAKLQAAGITVLSSNADAVELALRHVGNS